MSDLISRSALIENFRKCYSGHLGMENSDACMTFHGICNVINNTNTVYDIDKVVEDLELHSFEFGTDTLPAHYVRLNEAIEIVKQGGVGTETETIRDKAVKWNNNSSKRVPYEFIDYVEGRREISVSDDVCEWELKNACYTTSIKHYYSLPTSIVKTFNNCPYCGKKIKVVE